MPSHRRPTGRHRAGRPPADRTRPVLGAALLGAAAAALTTGAAGVPDPQPAASEVAALLPAGLPAAEVPLTGRLELSVTESRTRFTTIRGTRDARVQQLALVEAARPKWAAPMAPGSYRISSSYGPRWGTTHRGLDMAAPAGTPIFAAADGLVLAPAGMSGYGNVIVLQHPDGQVTVYAHASRLLVEPGERIKAGQLVALVGSTGNSTGNHLHFEVRDGILGGQREPVSWLTARGIPV